MSTTRTKIFAGLAIITVVALGGCGGQQVRDLEGVTQTDPDKVRLVTNIDGYPNVVAICVEGEGFAATTRDNSQAALQHIPEWSKTKDGWCAK